VSTVFDPFFGHSQLLPQETPGSALCRTSHSAAADSEKVLLSSGSVPPQSLYREDARSDRGLVPTHETTAQRGARDRCCAPLGKGGERLVSKLGIPISDATLLWCLYLVPLPPIGKVAVIGIDDWSYRRGKRYGSIIVDLRTHKIIDLLPERSVASVIAWLEAHPSVEIVSRDRGGTYVDGVTQGAPLATQVCDRWHLLVRRLGAYSIPFGERRG
jgi:hypothetical protein